MEDDDVALPNQVTTTDKSVVVGTTAVQVLTKGFHPAPLMFLRVWNVASSGGNTIWLSRSGTAVVNGAGSFPLAPGAYEVFQHPNAVPNNPLSAVATGASTPLTVEFG